jgi:hypothetical protein
METIQNNRILDYERAFKDVSSKVKSLDRKFFKSVPKGTQYDWLNNTSFNNIVYPKDKIPDRLLRLIETRNPIVGAIITLRIQQAIEFSHISNDKDLPGWEFILKDKNAVMNKEREKQKAFLEEFLTNTHRDDYENYEKTTNDFRKLLIKFVRDRLLIDKVCWEIERDRKGVAVALHTIDGATILPVLPGGFYGSTSQVGVGVSAGFNKLTDLLRQEKLKNIPPIEEISYIQELIYGTSGGGITAAFKETDLIYDLGNELNDIRFYRQGLSVIEKANLAVVAFINALTYNSNGLTRGAIPKVAIAMGKESGYTQEELEDAQDEWMANFQAMDGQWNIPLLNGDAKVLNLNNTNREMEYQQYLEFTGALTCAVAGVDAAEIGLRLNQAQNVMNENADAKQQFSKDRGMKELLGGFAYAINRFLRISGFSFAKDWRFHINGIANTDKGFESDLRTKNVKSVMTIDEVRETLDLEPLPDGAGAIILDSVFIQNKQANAQAAQGQSMDGGQPDVNDEDEYDDMADEAMESLQKAVRII